MTIETRLREKFEKLNFEFTALDSEIEVPGSGGKVIRPFSFEIKADNVILSQANDIITKGLINTVEDVLKSGIFNKIVIGHEGDNLEESWSGEVSTVKGRYFVVGLYDPSPVKPTDNSFHELIPNDYIFKPNGVLSNEVITEILTLCIGHVEGYRYDSLSEEAKQHFTKSP